MFNTKQTRLIIACSILIAVMLCFIGRNWQRGGGKAAPVKAVLSVPAAEKYDTGDFVPSVPAARVPGGKTIEFGGGEPLDKEKKPPAGKDSGEKTIILD